MKKIDNPFIIKNTLISIKGFRRLKEEGTHFWFKENQEKMNLSITRQKFRLILLILIISLSLILARVFWLQIIQGQNYNLIAEGNRIRLATTKAERGIIYDRFGQPLVANLANYSLHFIPADLPDDDQSQLAIAQKLSRIIQLGEQDLIDIFSQAEHSYQPQLITDQLSHRQAVTLSVVELDLPGIQLNIQPRRQYLEDSGLAHILGYVGKINQAEIEQLAYQDYDFNSYLGKDGIELAYEQILKGVSGKQEIEVDATGKTKKILNEIEPQIGQGIVLTIDLDLQQKLTQTLSEAVRNTATSQAAVAIALDPNSGEILALVSLPDFDNNFFSAGIDQSAYQNYLTNPAKPLFNRAISGTYPPGSTFKPIVALAALEEGIINKQKTFLSTGGLQIGQWFFPDWKYGGHGRVNVITAIAESVNTFFYYLGGGYNNFPGLGVEKITQFARKFHLSSRLGIDLPGEAAGFLPTKQWKQEYKQEPWYIGDTYHLAIGQGDILVTPLQVAAYTAVIANGGTLYQPHLLKEIKSANGSSQENLNNDHILSQNSFNPDNIDIVRQGLRAAVTRGSAQSLQYLPVTVAGKTGTAQVGGDKESHAWFTGFAPYQSPTIVLIVLLENGGEGSAVAVPVFKQIMEWYFSEN